jgi:hypothetical protein
MPVTVMRRYRVRDVQGGCSSVISTTGWLYEVDIAAGGDFRIAGLGGIALSRRPGWYRAAEASREAAGTVGAAVWNTVAAHAAVAAGAGRPLPRSSLVEQARLLSLRAGGVEYSFLTVPLTVTESDWDRPVYATWVIGRDGAIVQRFDADDLAPLAVVEDGAGNDALLLFTGLIRFRDGRWHLPEILPFDRGSC